MNRRVGGVLVAYLFAFAFSLISTWAHGKVIIVGEAKGQPGGQFELSVEVEAGTILTDFQITPELELSPALVLLTLDLSGAATDGGVGFCVDSNCTYSYPPAGKLFAQQTVLVTLHYRIRNDAENFIDKADPTIPLMLGLASGGGAKVDGEFTLLAVPEPSTYTLIAVGFLLLAARTWRRQSEVREVPAG